MLLPDVHSSNPEELTRSYGREHRGNCEYAYVLGIAVAGTSFEIYSKTEGKTCWTLRNSREYRGRAVVSRRRKRNVQFSRIGGQLLGDARGGKRVLCSPDGKHTVTYDIVDKRRKRKRTGGKRKRRDATILTNERTRWNLVCFVYVISLYNKMNEACAQKIKTTVRFRKKKNRRGGNLWFTHVHPDAFIRRTIALLTVSASSILGIRVSIPIKFPSSSHHTVCKPQLFLSNVFHSSHIRILDLVTACE